MKPPSDNQLGLFDAAPEEAWSYSRLKSLRRCALEYKMRWVQREQGLFQPGYIDVQVGRVLHHIVREYYRGPRTSEPHRLLLEGYEKLAPRTAAWKDDLQGETRVLRALRLFAESRTAAIRPVALEVSCKARIAGVLFAGAADVVHEADEVPGSYGILDFKLTDVEVRSEDPAERFLQCTLYYIGLPERLRRLSELVSVYVFDTGQLLTAKIEESLIRGAIQLVETALGRAHGPDFPPTLNAFCPSCGYQALCPAYSNRQRKR